MARVQGADTILPGLISPAPLTCSTSIHLSPTTPSTCRKEKQTEDFSARKKQKTKKTKNPEMENISSLRWEFSSVHYRYLGCGVSCEKWEGLSIFPVYWTLHRPRHSCSDLLSPSSFFLFVNLLSFCSIDSCKLVSL